MKNKKQLEKRLNVEKKKRQEKENKFFSNTVSKEVLKKQKQSEAQRRLDTEVKHQTEEAERSTLGKAMMSDAAANRPSFNNSCLMLLNNFQGIFY